MSKQILRDSLAVRRILEVNPSDLKDDVTAINRVTKVVKGEQNLSFSALMWWSATATATLASEWAKRERCPWPSRRALNRRRRT